MKFTAFNSLAAAGILFTAATAAPVATTADIPLSSISTTTTTAAWPTVTYHGSSCAPRPEVAFPNKTVVYNRVAGRAEDHELANSTRKANGKANGNMFSYLHRSDGPEPTAGGNWFPTYDAEGRVVEAAAKHHDHKTIPAPNPTSSVDLFSYNPEVFTPFMAAATTAIAASPAEDDVSWSACTEVPTIYLDNSATASKLLRAAAHANAHADYRECKGLLGARKDYANLFSGRVAAQKAREARA